MDCKVYYLLHIPIGQQDQQLNMKYYILNTKEESDQCRLECYRAILDQNKSERFAMLTTEWSSEQIRITDGKYIVPECPYIDSAKYTVEDSDTSWFPLQKI